MVLQSVVFHCQYHTWKSKWSFRENEQGQSSSSVTYWLLSLTCNKFRNFHSTGRDAKTVQPRAQGHSACKGFAQERLQGRLGVNAPVEVGVGGALDVQGAAADVIDGLVVQHDRDIRVLQQRVRGQHGVVRLNHSCGHLGSTWQQVNTEQWYTG